MPFPTTLEYDEHPPVSWPSDSHPPDEAAEAGPRPRKITVTIESESRDGTCLPITLEPRWLAASEAAAAVTLDDVRRAPRLQELGPAVPMIEDQALVDWATDWQRRFEPLSPQSIDRLSVGRRSVWRTVAGVVLVAAAGYVAYESVRWHRRDAGRVVEGGGRSRSVWNHVGLAGGLSLAGVTGGTGRMMLGPWSRVRVIEQGYL